MYMVFNRAPLCDRLNDSTLRLLTETEIEWVAGGSSGYGDEIVVVGKRYRRNVQFNYWFPVETSDPGSGYDFGEIHGGGPTPDPTPPPPPPVYNTPGASQAANDFAKQNMDDQNSSDPEFKQFNKAPMTRWRNCTILQKPILII